MPEPITRELILDRMLQLAPLYEQATTVLELQAVLFRRAQRGEDVGDEWAASCDRLRELEAKIKILQQPFDLIAADAPDGGVH